MALAKNILKNAIGAFIAPLLTLNVLEADVSVWKTSLSAAATAILIGVYNWTNPRDDRFGR